MPNPNNWTREQTLAALHVYLQLPFGQLHQRNPTIKQLAGWIGRTPGAVALKLVNLASLDPQVVASGRAGMANASNLDREVWAELDENCDALVTEAGVAYERYGSAHGVLPGSDVVDEVPELGEGRTITAIVQVRVNQARFRRAVMASYNARCCISGLKVPRLLIASHIVPWSEDHTNRLNPRNGLCLSALHDKAFDQGLITVLPDFRVRVSKELNTAHADEFTRAAIAAFDGRSIRLPERFKPDEAFLTAHAKRFGFL